MNNVLCHCERSEAIQRPPAQNGIAAPVHAWGKLPRNDDEKEGNRLSHALVFANKLSESRLREMAESYESRWTPQRRAEKACLIQKYRPWRFACGPRSAAGKARAAQNAFRHGGRSAGFNRLNAALAAQRLFVKQILLARRLKQAGQQKTSQPHLSALKGRMELGETYRQMKTRLREGGVSTPDLDAQILLRQVTGVCEADFIAHPQTPVSGEHRERLEAAMRRRLSGEPVSRILGEREFWGMSFRVTKDTLDPRADTETLVAAALKAVEGQKNLKILDMGTGTGCILISLLKEIPDARGVALDVSLDALRVARENARRHGVEDRMSFLCGNWGEALCGDSFHLIVSNPPYILESDIESLEKEVKNHDPILALAGGKDGLAAYRVIFTATKRLLITGGRGFFELGFGQLGEAMRLASDSNLSSSRTHDDLAGIPRVLEITNGEN